MEFSKIFNQKLSIRACILVVASSVLVAAAVEIKALRTIEPSADHVKKFNAAECVRCHHDQKSIDGMRMKEDGAGYIFNADGSFKDPKLAKLYPVSGKSNGKLIK